MTIIMAKKSVEKRDLNQVSGGRVNVRERMAMYKKLNEPQMPLPKKGPTPGKIDIVSAICHLMSLNQMQLT